MRLMTGRWLVVGVLLVGASDVLLAGQIYGTIVLGGQGVKERQDRDPVRPGGGRDRAPRPPTAPTGSTCRSRASARWRCRPMRAARRPSIFSSPNPALYNFELAKLADGKYELKRR